MHEGDFKVMCCRAWFDHEVSNKICPPQKLPDLGVNCNIIQNASPAYYKCTFQAICLSDVGCSGAPIQDLGFGTWLANSLQRQNLGLLDKTGTFLGPFWDLSGTFCRYFDDTTTKLTQD